VAGGESCTPAVTGAHGSRPGLANHTARVTPWKTGCRRVCRYPESRALHAYFPAAPIPGRRAGVPLIEREDDLTVLLHQRASQLKKSRRVRSVSPAGRIEPEDARTPRSGTCARRTRRIGLEPGFVSVAASSPITSC